MIKVFYVVVAYVCIFRHQCLEDFLPQNRNTCCTIPLKSLRLRQCERNTSFRKPMLECFRSKVSYD